MMNYPYSKGVFALLVVARFLYALMFSSALVFLYFFLVGVQVLGIEGQVSSFVYPILGVASLILAFIPALLPLWLKSKRLSPPVATSRKSKIVVALDFATVRFANSRKHSIINIKVNPILFFAGFVGLVVGVAGFVVVSVTNSNLDAFLALMLVIYYFGFVFPDDGERVVAPSTPSSNTAKALSRI